MDQSFSQTLKLICSDMRFRCKYEHKTFTLLRAIGFLLNPTIFSQVLFRWQGFFYSLKLTWISRFLETINSIFFTVNIDSSAQIGPGFMLLHANYIYIGRNVTIGERCILAQQNVITPAYTADKVADLQIGPMIGDDVLFGVGSAAVGAIKIGHRSKVGINSAIEKDFPDDAILIGVPAKNINLV